MQGEATSGIIPFIWISGVIVLGLVLLIVVFFLLYQRRLLRQQDLMRELELHKQVELMAAVIEGQENERKRMAHDLHDGVGAMLTTIRMGLWSLEKKAPESAARIVELRGWVDDTLENVRTVSRDLMPPTLERVGLADAVKLLMERVASSGEVAITTQMDLQGLRGAAITEIHLYRIIQELLNNAIRHGKARHIQCALTVEGGAFRLRFVDDGLGFDLQTLQAKGLGLKNIESRVTLMHGEMQVDAAPGKGAAFEFVVPMALPGVNGEDVQKG